jgi:DNA-binding transcriptional MerR regulator
MTNIPEIDSGREPPADGEGGNDTVVPLAGIGIGAIAHEIGLTKDTLRVWERRYGFPQPMRSPGGERLYPQEQVTKLRLVKRLLDAGHRPSKVLVQSIEMLQQLAQESGVGQDAPDVELDRLIRMLRTGAYDDFRFELLKRATRDGLERFVLDIAAPLSARVGNAWAAGTLQVYHEHLFSEAMQVTLLSECECMGLGTQTPLHDIVDAVNAHKLDIVALSFSASMPAQAVSSGLAELRNLLPAEVGIWVGGSSPVLRRKLPEGVEHVPGLTPIDETVATWRQAATQAAVL